MVRQKQLAQAFIDYMVSADAKATAKNPGLP